MYKLSTGATLRSLCLPPPLLFRFPSILASSTIIVKALIVNLGLTLSKSFSLGKILSSLMMKFMWFFWKGAIRGS